MQYHGFRDTICLLPGSDSSSFSLGRAQSPGGIRLVESEQIQPWWYTIELLRWYTFQLLFTTYAKKSRIYSSPLDFSTIFVVITRFGIKTNLKTYRYEKSVF